MLSKKIVIAGLIVLQQNFLLAIPATVVTSTALLGACSTSAERADTRQNTRIENRTEGRYENRRGED
jgi:hypothetical protein